jgi:hypothetical protein
MPRVINAMGKIVNIIESICTMSLEQLSLKSGTLTSQSSLTWLQSWPAISEANSSRKLTAPIANTDLS